MNEQISVETAILGAGFAGIGAAHAVGKDAVIFERDDVWGGLCGNFTVDGFRFDKAVHLSFVSEKLTKEIFYSNPYYTYPPEAMNYVEGCWVRHPIQNNSCRLPIEERIKIIKSFIERSHGGSEPGNYREWLEMQFGTYFAETYPARYTRKYWAAEAEELSTSWCGGRLYLPSLDEVLRGAFTDETPNTYYAKAMHYPKNGGYSAFVKDIAGCCHIEYGREAVSVDSDRKIIQFRDGSECRYSSIISTIPLPELVKMVRACPEKVLSASRMLESTRMALVSVAFNKKIDFPSLWFYVYDEDVPFARAYAPGLKSPDNVPPGRSSLQCEVYSSTKMPLKYDDAELERKTVQCLTRMQIAEISDIAFVDVRHVPFANVIFFRGMEGYRKMCLDFVRSCGITVAGRFGEWDYLWSGQAFMSGYNAGRKVKDGCR